MEKYNHQSNGLVSAFDYKPTNIKYYSLTYWFLLQFKSFCEDDRLIYICTSSIKKLKQTTDCYSLKWLNTITSSSEIRIYFNIGPMF